MDWYGLIWVDVHRIRQSNPVGVPGSWFQRRRRPRWRQIQMYSERIQKARKLVTSFCACTVARTIWWDNSMYLVLYVWNISIDVKLVPWYILVAGERWAFLESPLNEDTPSLLWYAIWTQIARACARFSNRLSSEPARRFVFPLHVCTVAATNFNEDHIWILLMLSLWTDEGDKFGLHSSLLAQLKTVVLWSSMSIYFLLDMTMMAFHLWSFQLSFLASVTNYIVFCTPDAFHITIR